MKLLKDISEDLYKADQENLALKYLQQNKTIGGEDVKDEPNLFHCFWVGDFIPKHHLLCIKSLLATQNVEKVYIWVPDLFKIAITRNVFKGLNKVEIKQFDRSHFEQLSNVSDITRDKIFSKYNSLMNVKSFGNHEKQYAYASDIFRFVILNIYGGIYFDLDNLFLRNLNDIKIKRYVSQWFNVLAGNASIMRLEKDHDLIDPIVKTVPMYFYPQGTFEIDKPFDITILHRAFFDILWEYPEIKPTQFIPFVDPNDFFKATSEEIKKETFLKGAFGYHWHNRWNVVPEETSPFSQLLSQF